jgi:hypothetical protein
MGGPYVGDASWLDSAGCLLMVVLFLITGLRNLQKYQVEDHILDLSYFLGQIGLARARSRG